MIAPSIDSGENIQTSSNTQQRVEQPTPKLPSVLPVVWLGSFWAFVKIHFTNLCLSLITLGIYSPWAKVRTKRYFYGNTAVFNMTFDFDARPITILIARIILISIIGFFFYLQENFDLTIGDYSFGGLLFFFLLPLLTVRGHAFNARHTTLNNVRFKFKKIFFPSYAHFFTMTLPLFAGISLFGYWFADTDDTLLLLHYDYAWFLPAIYTLIAYVIITFPINWWWRHRIRINQLSLGKLKFRFKASPMRYVRIYAIHFVLISAMLIHINQTATYESGIAVAILMMILLAIYLYLIALSMFAFFARAFWNGIRTADGSEIKVKFNPLYYALVITLVNHILILFTAGLFIPIAKVRRWRYIAERFKFLPSDQLREVISTSTEMETALAEEWVDMDGFDFDFGMI